MNGHMAKMLGYEPEELIGKAVEPLIPSEEEVADFHAKVERRRLYGKSERYERRLRRKDGKLIWTLASVNPLRNNDGVFSGSFGMFTDITYLKQTQTDLREAKETAESATRAMSQFLDIAAHELRTPLTSLTLLVQSSQRRVENEKPLLPNHLERMMKQARRLTILIEDLLNVSRLERGGFPLRIERSDLLCLAREIIEEFKTRFPDRKFKYESPSGTLMLDIDPGRISQVLTNLLDNAVKYSPNGTPVDLTIKSGNDYAVVSAKDHGHGIPLDQQSRLFSKFFRAQNEKTLQQPGLGLGLYLCRQIIELHGGFINVASSPGNGSTFSFSLPIG